MVDLLTFLPEEQTDIESVPLPHRNAIKSLNPLPVLAFADKASVCV
jgi:hypothetical protein